MRVRSILAAGLVIAMALPAAAEDALLVTMDQVVIKRLSAPASTIIIGNPSIADVTLQDSQTLVVTGRGYGTTNMLILDDAGETIADTQVSVEAPTLNTIVMYKGPARYTYSCVPVCQATVVPGDASDHFSTAISQSGARNGNASGAAASVDSGSGN